MKRRVFLTLLVSDEEKEMLERLTEETGGGGMSAYVRRMIRQEAMRLGLVPARTATAPEAEAVTA